MIMKSALEVLSSSVQPVLSIDEASHSSTFCYCLNHDLGGLKDL